MAHIFISYSRADRVYAEILRDDLLARGFDVWLDTAALEPSRDWWHEIEHGIEGASAFVLLMTPDSDASRYVNAELNHAQYHNRPVFPLLLAQRPDNRPLFTILGRIQYENVLNGGLPSPDFYRMLAKVAPPDTSRRGTAVAPPAPTTLPESAVFLKKPVTSPPKPVTAKTARWAIIPAIIAISLIIVVIATRNMPPDYASAIASPTPSPAPTDTDAPAPTITPLPSTTPSVFIAMYEAGDSNDTWSPQINSFGDDEFARVPSGCFIMGITDEQFELSLEDCLETHGLTETNCRNVLSNEQPAHRVCLHEFLIGRTEVTNAQYQRCVDAGACTPGNQANEDTYNAPTQPVVDVTWNQANAYADWLSTELGLRCTLPTEAQWAYAARGPEALLYPWGNGFGGTCQNYCDAECASDKLADEDYNDGYSHTAPVGSYDQWCESWVGAADMAGNVWEWVADWYDVDYYSTVTDAQLDPTGATTGEKHLLRGGGWGSTRYWTRSTSRFVPPADEIPEGSNKYRGFRVVCTP
jgi:sulfatase modifying factor 1